MSARRPGEAGLSDLVRRLRRRRLLIGLCVLVSAGSALGFSLLQTKQYSASASLLFRDPGLGQTLFGSPVLAPSNDAEREGTTNVKLVSLPVVAERTAERLGRAGEPVLGKIAVQPEGQSNVVSVTAKDPNPRFAARLANAFAQEYIRFRREADRRKINDARRLVRKQIKSLSREARPGPRGRSLQDRFEQLGVLASLQTGNAELVQNAKVPGAPSEPRPVTNTVLGGVLGLILGLALALVLERLDRRIKDPGEIGELFGRPVLAAIPQAAVIRTATVPVAVLTIPEAEAFRMLRANLRYFKADRDVRSVLVTSAAPGDGKSTVAWNLAAAEAASGSRVLLVEADLRHPVMAERYGLTGPGLSGVLAGQDPRAGATVRVALAPDETGGPAMDVIPAGDIPPNPADLIGSERMVSLLRSAEQSYDLVVLDTPPTSVVSDAIPLVTQVSGVIPIARIGKTSRDACIHLNHQLENLDAPVLGVVVNGLDARREGYYGSNYVYGYTEYSPRRKSKDGADAPTVVASPSPTPAAAPGWSDSEAGNGAGTAVPEPEAPRAVAAGDTASNGGPFGRLRRRLRR